MDCFNKNLFIFFLKSSVQPQAFLQDILIKLKNTLKIINLKRI